MTSLCFLSCHRLRTNIAHAHIHMASNLRGSSPMVSAFSEKRTLPFQCHLGTKGDNVSIQVEQYRSRTFPTLTRLSILKEL